MASCAVNNMLYNNGNPCLKVNETALERGHILGGAIALTELHSLPEFVVHLSEVG